MSHFRENNFDIHPHDETVKDKKKKKKKNSKSDWTWKDQVELVKWQDHMIDNSLMRLDFPELNKVALECFACIMRFMGDMPLMKNQMDVECALMVLSYCYKHEEMKDEVYCQIMKQLTANRNSHSEQRGWDLLWLATGLFPCSKNLMKDLTLFQKTHKVRAVVCQDLTN